MSNLYTIGKTVRIVDGPFTDFEGEVCAIDNNLRRVIVLVSFFGRETRVDLEFIQVTKVSHNALDESSVNNSAAVEKSIALAESEILPTLERLRTNLLDISGRNNQVNFKRTPTRVLSFAAPSTQIGKILLDNTSVELLHLGTNNRLGLPDGQKPEAGLRELEAARANRIATASDASATAATKTLQTLLFVDAYAKSARRFEREMVSALQETGTHILFLCIGFLSYPEEPGSRTMFRAPLINIPVFIKRGEGSHGDRYTLTYTGDDLSVNLSLREKLRVTYNLTLPPIIDEGSFSEINYINEIRSLTQKLPNFSVEHHVCLALLSFSNMILFEDLDPQQWKTSNRLSHNALLHHPNVQRVISGASMASSTAADIPNPTDSEDYALEGPDAPQISFISDADSSQHQAIIDAVVGGKDMVIIGPPGTGKSQTITNLIATFIEQGKSVLFVAEKLAALEVVRNRLAKAGLSPFLLEIHSNKVNKKQILESVSDRLEYRVSRRLDTPKDARLEHVRLQLAAYVQHIGATDWNALSQSAFDVFWHLMVTQSILDQQSHPHVHIPMTDAVALDPITHDDNLTKLQTLALCAEQLTTEHYSSFSGIVPVGPQSIPVTVLRQIFAQWQECIAQLRDTAKNYQKLTGDDIVPGGRDAIKQRADLVQQVLQQWPSTLDTTYLARLAPSAERTQNHLLLLTNLTEQIHSATKLAADTNAGLRDGVNASKDNALRGQEFFAYVTGVFDPPHDTNALGNWISTSSLQLEALQASITQLLNHPLASRFLPTGEANLETVHNLAELTTHWNASAVQFASAYHTAFMQKGVIVQLHDAHQMAQKIQTLHADVSARIFLTQLPQIHELREAFQAIRNGDAWWDFWKSDVRAARKLHNRISSTTTKSSAEQRLNDFRDLLLLLDTQISYDTHPLWNEYLKQPADTKFPFDTTIALANWVATVMQSYTNKNLPLTQCWPQQSTAVIPFIQSIKSFSTHAQRVQHDVLQLRQLFNRDSVTFAPTERLRSLVDRIARAKHMLSSGVQLLQTHFKHGIPFLTAQRGVEAHLKFLSLCEDLTNRGEFASAFGALYSGLTTNTALISQLLTLGKDIHALGLTPNATQSILRSSEPRHTTAAIDAHLSQSYNLLTDSADLIAQLRTHCNLTSDFLLTTNAKGILPYTDALITKLQYINKAIEFLPTYLKFLQIATLLKSNALERYVDGVTNGSIRYDALVQTYLFNVWQHLASEACTLYPDLEQFNQHYFNQLQSDFRMTDETVISQKGDRIAKHLLEDTYIPNGTNGGTVDKKTDMVLLRYLLPQVKPRIPVRKLLKQAGDALKALKPCFMMSPQSVAQFLIPGGISFDVVIMDEASQMTPAEALGSVARGTQLIVVGDPKQLPPTQFFSRIATQTDDTVGQDIADSESILEVCLSQFETKRDLRWHYRSQHHSLIAFSNDQFYKNRLNVFPSPHSINTELGIQTFYLKHGRYALQTNFAEGEQIVTLVRQHIESQPTYSLGIVTLNLKQRELVSELLEQELGLLPAFRTYKQQWEAHGDPFFVKNLENVQGDERDTIIISTTFGPDPETRKISQNFGPISRSNGWRRLNVLFTRAKRSIKLVTSLRPADLSITENTRDGTQALKKYLEYAQRANLITIDRSQSAESHPLASHLVDLLRRNGYECRTQLGVAGFHIDIAVCHPHIPHTYIAALTADGHNYASAQTVRDRERIRQNVLTQIGWKDRIYRIWSPEWHQNPSDALKRLLKFLAPLRQKANLDRPIVHIEEDHTIDPPIALEHDATSSAGPDDDMMAKIRRLLS